MNAVHHLMERHGLTRSRLGDYLGVSTQNIYNWLDRGSDPSAIVQHTIRLLDIIERALPELHASLLADKSNDARDWLDRADELDRLKRRYRMDVSSLAAYLGVPRQTVAQWMTRTRKSPKALNRTLQLLGLIEAFMPEFHKGAVHRAKYPVRFVSKKSKKGVDR